MFVFTHLAVALVSLPTAFTAPGVVEPQPFTQSATTVDELLELGRPIVLAHTGGEDEFPGSTMYAFRQSMAAGVDVLDLNVVMTADGVLAVQHDFDVDRSTDGTGQVADMTFEELHALDDAYWWTAACGTCHDQPDDAYEFRGIRTGDRPPPTGFTADDFAVPRLEELLDTFPNIPLGIEVKADGAVGAETADALISMLTEYERLDSVVVSSFSDEVIAHVQQIAPTVDVSPAAGALTAFLADGTPLPAGQRIVQPPPLPADKVAAFQDAGHVVWVWPNDRALENPESYEALLLDGYDGLNINYPADGVAAVESFLSRPRSAPFEQSARTIDEVLALGRPIVLAHNGGEAEFPGGTMYAFGESMKAGVDMLDLNVQLTSDGVLAVQHDLDVDRTTNGTGRILDMTFDEIHALDNAYFFTADCGVCTDEPAEAYIYRGIRSGDAELPAGYTADDFAMPRLEEVLEAFPDVPLSIEIKDNGDRARAIADVLIDVLREHDRLDGVVIASFEDALVDYVHELAPGVDVTSLSTSVFHLLEGRPMQDYTRIVQPSARFEERPVFDADTLAAEHEAGLAVWVWPNERIFENTEGYTGLLTLGVDGINANYPATAVASVEAFLSDEA